MLNQIRGLHHVTSLASSARINNDFFTRVMGLRRVKKTVNFDRPEVYHLYFGNEFGVPGTVMTYFPDPKAAPRRKGVGEVGRTGFAIPPGSKGFWKRRLAENGATDISELVLFGEDRVHFSGPDGDEFALVERDDSRSPWVAGEISEEVAIRGFHHVSMRLNDSTETAELLRFMGYREAGQESDVTRFEMPGGNGADVVEIEILPDAEPAQQGAGSVHHVAFAVENRARQLEVREALLDAGHRVTEVRDRNYFWAIYFRSPGGVLFEVATTEPGFDSDEDVSALGTALRLPAQHEALRAELEQSLEALPS